MLLLLSILGNLHILGILGILGNLSILGNLGISEISAPACAYPRTAPGTHTTIHSPTGSAAPSPTLSGLSPAERASLKMHLENLSNEEELMIKNHKADLSDIRKQEQTFSALKVYERIPEERKLKDLERELSESARNHHLQLSGFQITHYSPEGKKPPRMIYTDDPPFYFTLNQLVEIIHFQAVVKSDSSSNTRSSKKPDEESVTTGDLGNVGSAENSGDPGNSGPLNRQLDKWTQDWPDEILRIIQLESKRILSQNEAIIFAHAYRFRAKTFPVLKPRNPLELLPRRARKDLALFSNSSKEDETLLNFIKKIQALAPQAIPLYGDRGRLLLLNKRMDFFLSLQP